MKKTISLILALLLTFALCACAEKPSGEAAEKTYTIGICQITQHPALDAATEGFKTAIREKLGDRVTFLDGNALGDPATCAVICGQFVAEEADLILANATPSLQAAAAATNSIPILGTSVTDFGTALAMELNNGATGVNISGTSDFVSSEDQAALVKELFPDAGIVGLLYCSGEDNSLFQAQGLTVALEALGYEVKSFTFADSNDVAAVTETACDGSDVIFIPTDNTAASCAEAIRNVAVNAGTPIICGEEGACAGCGVATLTISYYELGYATGEMALEILNGADISQMPVRRAPTLTRNYNAEICAALGLTVPEGYVPIGD